MNTPQALSAPQRVVACYPRYADAERAVDHLSDQKFPVRRTQIVGRGLDLVEQVTGRRTYWSAAGGGALTGAVIGAIFGWLFGIFGWVDLLISGLLLALYGALYGAVIGAVLGALFGLLGHAMTGGRRDFDSVNSFRAQSYDVLVEQDAADEAERLLTTDGGPGLGTRPF